MRVTLDELVTGAEAGRRLGVSRQRIKQLSETESLAFPAPVGKVGQATVWRWADIEKWARRTGRLDP